MSEKLDDLSIALFSELFMADQLARSLMDKTLPKGMELSHFSVLNHLSYSKSERTPAQLAKTFHVTRGAMTNTLSKLEIAGHVHIRPDWDDARRKLVSISPAGAQACEQAFAEIAPALSKIVNAIGADKARNALPILRSLRERLDEL